MPERDPGALAGCTPPVASRAAFPRTRIEAPQPGYPAIMVTKELTNV
jgi:hypothetical protein